MKPLVITFSLLAMVFAGCDKYDINEDLSLTDITIKKSERLQQQNLQESLVKVQQDTTNTEGTLTWDEPRFIPYGPFVFDSIYGLKSYKMPWLSNTEHNNLENK